MNQQLRPEVELLPSSMAAPLPAGSSGDGSAAMHPEIGDDDSPSSLRKDVESQQALVAVAGDGAPAGAGDGDDDGPGTPPADGKEAGEQPYARVGYCAIAKEFSLLGWTAFGGPSAHIGLFQRVSGRGSWRAWRPIERLHGITVPSSHAAAAAARQIDPVVLAPDPDAAAPLTLLPCCLQPPPPNS